MSEEEFLAAITGHDSDLKLAVGAPRATGQAFCLIGGLAVNHYVEPVVTLDADFAIAGATGLADALRARGFAVETVPHSVNAQLPGSRLRIQITVNSRSGAFPGRAVAATVFGVGHARGFSPTSFRASSGPPRTRPAGPPNDRKTGSISPGFASRIPRPSL